MFIFANMLLYWKFLLLLGSVLWAALCLSDYIYSKDIAYNTYICDDSPLEPEIVKEEEINWMKTFLNQYIDLQAYISFHENSNITLKAQWVSLTFLCTIIFYLIGRVFFSVIANYQLRVRVPANVPAISSSVQEPEKDAVPIIENTILPPIVESVRKRSDLNLKESSSISKIPVSVARHEAQSPISRQDSSSLLTGSSSVHYDEDLNKSCPNLSPKASAMKNKELFSLYDNKVNNIKSSKSVNRLRDEIVLLQATSFREQEILSRKLDAIVKEKRNLSNALANSLRENKSAKRKLEDIQKEREILIRQLESATNEIKSNTKSKKLTLSRLEKAIEESKNMKNEFSRLNEEKKKLEETVISLDKECREMRARTSILNKSYSEIKQDYDGDNTIHDKTDDDSITSGYYEVTDKQLRQSNIDMNKVQTKLNDLEKSLEKLKFSSTITKERERSLQEESSEKNLTEEMEKSIEAEYGGSNSESKFMEDDDDEDSMESQNANYNHGDAVLITSVSSMDIDDCQSLCLVPGCLREHNICENPVCIYEHTMQDQLNNKKEHYNPEQNLNVNRVTSANQIILEAVKEKSTVLASRSSLFDTKEARARLAAFFSVSLWSKKDESSRTTVAAVSDDSVSIDSEFQKTEFEYEEWAPKLVHPGIVSQSPAFQKFLSSVIIDQRNAIMEQKNLRTG